MERMGGGREGEGRGKGRENRGMMGGRGGEGRGQRRGRNEG